MGGKNDDKAGGTTTSVPWEPQGQALQFGFNEARTAYNNGYTPYDSQLSQSVINNASSISPQASQQLGSTIQGDYLGKGNPYLDDLVAKSSRNAMSGINSTFGGAGRTGGGLHQQALATGLGDVATSVYAPAYEAERSRQLNAVQASPEIMRQQLQFSSAIEEGQELADYENLQRYMQIVGGAAAGGSTTGPSTPGRGALAGAAGGAAAGASIGTSISPGWGTAIGAVVGGVGGAVGVV